MRLKSMPAKPVETMLADTDILKGNLEKTDIVPIIMPIVIKIKTKQLNVILSHALSAGCI